MPKLPALPALSISPEKAYLIAAKARQFDAKNDDEQIDLVALAWLGRGDGDIGNWDELRAEAARAHNKRTAAYLLGKPMLADHLEEALSKFGYSSGDVEPDLF